MLKVLIAFENVPDGIFACFKGHRVEQLRNGDSLASLVTHGDYHLVLAPGRPGLVPEIKAADPRTEVILLGDDGYDSVTAVKDGAFAFMTLPIDVERLSNIIRDVDEMFAGRIEAARLEEQLDQKYTFAGIVGKDPKMLDIISFIKRVAPYYKVVTITGETGTGKEVVARALHDLGSKRTEPFLASNCAGYVETLIESELFGHQKGSFTGAIKDKMGLFEAARDGTLFLDEIGDLPLSFQPHLLRVLQSGEFRPVGSHRVLQSRCKIIAATGKDLKEEIRTGRFREDLFYRLTPLTIHIPPLRERKDDIPLLSRFLLKKYNAETGKAIRGISRPAQHLLLSHDWPGNIRELENVINQAVILAEDSFIGPNHFPSHLRAPVAKKQVVAGDSLAQVVKAHIEIVLEQCKGNKSRAAVRLGVSRRALFRKLEKYGIGGGETEDEEED
jgi:DNA-binding NtrC family response regulator